MKCLFCSFVPAALLLFSCQKEGSPVSQVMMPLTIDALIPETRTSTSSDFKLSWAEHDTLLVAMKTESPTAWGWGSIKAARFVYDSKSSLFHSDAAVSPGEYELAALYSGNKSQNAAFRFPEPTYTLMNVQQQNSSSEKALAELYLNDALAGSCTTTLPGGKVTMPMHHLFSLMKVTLRNSTGEDIRLSSLAMTAETEIAGTYQIDFSGTVPKVGTCTDGKKSVTVFLSEEVLLEASSTFDFYYLIAPVSGYNGNITLQATGADGRIYSKTVKVSGLDFEAGKLNKTNFTVTEADPMVFKLYEGALTEGDYIVTSSHTVTAGTFIYAMRNEVSGERMKYSEVSVSDKQITTDDMGIVWHIALNGTYWTIYNSRVDSYLAGTGSKNKAQLLDSGDDDKSLWTSTGTYEFVNKYNQSKNVNSTLRLNFGTGFGTYKGDDTIGEPLTLYKKEGGSSVVSRHPAADVSASSVTGVTKSSASFSASYSNVSAIPTSVGFRYGKDESSLDCSVSASVTGTFSSTVSDLDAETTYWVRPYVTVSGTGEYSAETQTFYGETTSFKTTGGGGEEPGIGWLALFEVPACNVSLPSGSKYSSKVQETFGSTYAYVYETASSSQKVVTHTFSYGGKVNRTYTMLYDKDKKCALWTCFAMNGDAFPKVVKRDDNYRYDPALPESWQPKLSSAYSGYSRGHQVASADRLTCSDENHQTFYYSNMTPQLSSFNSSIWSILENSVQNVGYGSSGRDTLYVATGPIFKSGFKTTKDAASSLCAVPDQYWKCIMKCTFDSNGTMVSAVSAAYLFDHKSDSSRQTITVDELESQTGFNFFANVPSAIQDKAEASSYKFF